MALGFRGCFISPPVLLEPEAHGDFQHHREPIRRSIRSDSAPRIVAISSTVSGGITVTSRRASLKMLAARYIMRSEHGTIITVDR